MKLAVSNIAWPYTEVEAAYGLLRELGVRGLEIAPGLLFSGEADPFLPSEATRAANVQKITRAGLQLISMQSLLFGVEGALLFGDNLQRDHFIRGMRRAMDLAVRLGIGNLVLGSPLNRVIPTAMTRESALSIAIETFGKLGDYALARNCQLAVEPNPLEYGTNFLNTISETAYFLRDVAHPAVKLNLDLGAMHLTGEFGRIEALLAQHGELLAHVHISEPNLAPVPSDAAALARSLAALSSIGWAGWVSIEMRAPPGDRMLHLETAIHSCVKALAA